MMLVLSSLHLFGANWCFVGEYAANFICQAFLVCSVVFCQFLSLCVGCKEEYTPFILVNIVGKTTT
jgi:hypothetical protein